MPQRSIVATSARLVREFGGQVAISVAASAVAAAFLAAPEMLLLPQQLARAPMVKQQDKDGWVSPIAPDGKIAIRHRQAAPAGEVPVASALLMRASLVMPMNAGWPQAVFDEAPAPAARVRSTEAHPATAMAMPARKVPAAAERPKAAAEAAPLPIMPARLTTQDGAAATVADASIRTPSSGEATPSTLARVGNVMSGAVGTVGAAGIWTLSQASSLLPRL